MSNAHIWTALQQSAMVGVERLPVPQALASGADASAQPTRQALLAALRQPAPGAAMQLLRASAVAAVCERGGWQPGAQVALKAPLSAPPVAPLETRPAPEDEALHALMREVLADGPSDLRASMLRTLGQAGRRLPHDLLTLALEQGRQSMELRQWLGPVLGERGRWLGALNSQWAYAGGVEETADPEQIWAEGSVDQRVDLLRRERATEPARARARLEASLKELGAKERLPMVQALATGLGLEDEPLLEKLLADRSKEVRESVARMLSCLPGSAHSQRLMGWMRALLQQDDKGHWTVEPPEQAPKEWERDGILPKPHPYFRGGQKAWLLQQLVELTPLDFWTRTLDRNPVELMQWSRQSDWKAALRQGWLQALQYQQDAAWIDAAQMMGRDMRADTLMQALMARLSPAEREARWQAQFERDKGRLIEAIEAMAQSVPQAEQLSPHLSERLVDALHQALGGKQATGSWHSWQAGHALLSCARMLDVASLQRFAQLWRKPAAGQGEDAGAPAQTPAETAAQDAAPGASADAGPDASPDASPDAAARPLTPEQQARLERSRRRPWDDEGMRARLERAVALRLGLHQAFANLPPA